MPCLCSLLLLPLALTSASACSFFPSPIGLHSHCLCSFLFLFSLAQTREGAPVAQLHSRRSDSFCLIIAHNTFFPGLLLVPHLAFGSWSLSSAQGLCLLNLTWLIFPPSSSCWYVVALLILHETLLGAGHVSSSCWAG